MNPVATEPIQARQVRASLLHQPPWDKNLEEVVLGSVLLNQNTLASAEAILRPEDFYLRSHQKIFAAMSALRAEDTVIDPFTVGERLQGDEDFEGAGGRDYLLLLTQLPVAALDVGRHAEILKRISINRAGEHLSQQYLLGALDLAGLNRELAALLQEPCGVSPILSISQLYEEAPAEPDWIVKGILARQAITDLAAKVKLGKTHFALSLIAAVLGGKDFLGYPTSKTSVLYLTEERHSTFGAVCRRVGIKAEAGFHVLLRSKAPRDWPSTGALALREARRLGVGLVVIDTLSDWAGLAADEENDAGAALSAMRPLQSLAAADIGVLDLRHDRKGGSTDLADSARGSSAFSGAADILLGLRAALGDGHPNRRRLIGQGRFDGIPPELTVELVDGQYVSLGEGRAVARRETREAVLAVLPAARERAMSVDDIQVLCPQVKPTTLKEALKELAEEGVVGREKHLVADPRAFGYWTTEGAR